MIAAASITGRRRLQPTHNMQLIAEWLERRQNICNLEVRPFRRRRELVHDHPVRSIDEAKACGGICGGALQRRLCREHRVH